MKEYQLYWLVIGTIGYLVLGFAFASTPPELKLFQIFNSLVWLSLIVGFLFSKTESKVFIIGIILISLFHISIFVRFGQQYALMYTAT